MNSQKMKNLFIIDDTLSNKISYYHIMLFLIFLPFDRFYSELVLMSFLIHTIIQLKKTAWRQVFNIQLLVLLALLLLTAVSIIYTRNKAQGVSLLVRQLAMLLFPFILLINPIRLMSYRVRLFWIFTLVCLFTILYLYLDAFRVILYYHLPLRSILSSAFINHNFSLPVDLHATYLSMYIALSLVFLITVYYEEVSKRKKLFIISSMIVLLAGLLQLGSRAVLIAALLIGIFIIPGFLLTKKQRPAYLLRFITCLCLLCGVILLSDSLKNRYINELGMDLGKRGNSYSNTTPRIERWKLGFELVEVSPLIGYGSGDETDLLTEKYYAHKFYNAYLFRLNSHNQYLGFLLKSGLIGLLVYLWVLWYSFRIAVRKKDILFLGFLVIISTVSFSENYLDVNKGIFFYAFFLSFFIIAEKKSQPARIYSANSGNLQEPSSVFTY